MDLGNIKLSEISQTEKNKYYMISFTCGLLKSQTHRNSRMMVARSYGVGEMGKCWSEGTNFQL